uniref:UPF3B regulator of nonsense mediated mRNA decay n=1 Tax=Scophthalmus maximus TaxID=52904 RepID=A0A8D3DSY6_SCOMX
MKEDKENTRPKDKRVELKCEDGERMEKSKEKKEAMTKIVIRRLPPSLTKEELEEQLQPLPELDYMEFFSSDTSLYPHLFARAYINFKNQEDIVLFRDRFDGYVFIDNRGQEYPAVVEFAPFQKTAKKRSKKKDAKCGTIAEDPDYKKFLEYYTGDNEKFTSTPETLLEEIEAKSKELVAKKTTPLLDFLKNKQRIREEKKEERRRRELERKRLRDEERRKWREEDRRKRKDTEKMKRLEKPLEKDKDQVKEEPKIKVCAAKERRQKDKVRRQDEDRRRRRERQDGENSCRKREEEVKRDRERGFEKKKGENSGDSTHTERMEKPVKDYKKEESSKRERLRNKDRPAIQLYQPGARSRRGGGGGGGGGGGAESNSADRKPDTEMKKVADKVDD